MLVGIMSTFTNPHKLARQTALICKGYGIEIIFIRPDGVDINRGTVRGKMYINNRWLVREKKIPSFIDISPYCYKEKYKEVTDYLKEKTFLSDNGENYLTKLELQEHLKNDSNYAHLVIPTIKAPSYIDLINYLDEHSKIVIKPADGIQGKRIYIVARVENKFVVGYKTEEKHLTQDEFYRFFKKRICKKNYIIQKYVVSRSIQGDPFDCRIHVEKNGKGKWQSAINYIRIGVGQKVISNMSQGGGIASPEIFLKSNYGDKWEEINNRLKDIAITLPYKFEELKGSHVMSLGIDIGISPSGELYLFEVNDGPGFKFIVAEVAYIRSNYYKYIKNYVFNRPDEKKVKKSRYLKTVKERDYYKEKYESLVDELDEKIHHSANSKLLNKFNLFKKTKNYDK